jgi:hypothetical protein
LNNGALTVYEVVNERSGELLVGITERTMAVLIASHRFYRPGPVRRWDAEPRYRSVEFGLTPQDAAAYARRHAEERAREGWRVFCVN